MSQLTLRVTPELAAELKRAARERGQSVNAFAGTVLEAAVDPDAAGEEVDRLRERLARAGILTTFPAPDVVEPIDPEALAAARRAFAGGTLVSDLVSEGRS